MLSFRSSLALLALGLIPRGSEPVPPAVAVGQIHFEERSWGPGTVPTITFTVRGGRGFPEKVAAFLYVSEEPEAFQSTPYPPQFLGVLTVPSSIVVQVSTPERGPINEHTREKFVQGALFNPQTGAQVDVTNEDYLDIAYQAAPVTYALDFQTEDDFLAPLANGQDLSTPPEFGVLFSLSSLQPPLGAQHRGPAIFDSDPNGPNAGSSDQDLLVGLGNLMILQENPGQTVPGIFDLPDDAANGGTFVFDFTGFEFIEKVEPRSLDLIDVDQFGTGAKVFMLDVLGHSRFFTVPAGWTEDINTQGPPGFRTLDLTTLLPQPGFNSTATTSGDADFLPGEVVRMEVTLLGSGGIDNLVFARERDPGTVRIQKPWTGTGPRPDGPTRR